MFDHKLHRRALLRWMGLSGAAAMFPTLPLFPFYKGIQESDLPALTAANPILYDDDEPELVKLVRLIFERQGWTMIGTSSSHEALDVCRTQPISLVLSDIAKPDMSGLDLLDALRADPVTRDIPLVFFSACAFLHDRAMKSGANGFITKPVLPDDLINDVRAKLVECGRWRVLR
jgi:putative two-component system response regulator